MIQCFNKNEFYNTFGDHVIPKLVYSCKTEPHHAVLPRAMHMHPDKLEVVFIVSGEGMHRIGGVNYRTKKGDILIYNAGVLHDEIAVPEKELNVYCVAVTNLRLPGLEPNHLTQNGQKAVYSSRPQYDNFLSLFELVHSTTIGKEQFLGEINNYLTRALLIKLYALVQGTSHPEESEEARAERRIRQYIDRHYMEDISLKSISHNLHMSQYYIAHLFKDVEGFSPMQYVIRRRIGEAQSLLINTSLSVTDIAFRVGYKNSNHFHSAFLKIVGLTPVNYRKYWTAAQNHK